MEKIVLTWNPSPTQCFSLGAMIFWIFFCSGNPNSLMKFFLMKKIRFWKNPASSLKDEG
tara:strand:+ start:679 stop:855 length:177 start_codon:yes stop_codon:yes gene_type:complete